MKTLIAAIVALSAATALVAPASAGVSINSIPTFDGPAFGSADIKTFDGPAFGPADIKSFDGPAFGPSDIRSFDGPGYTSQDSGNQR